MITKAINLLCHNARFALYGTDEIIWYDERPQPTEEQIQAKIAELETAEPLRLLRIERDKLLTATDWRMTKDYPYADQAEWASYRTALRDLPATAEPALDENGNLSNVVWPTAPDDL